MMSWRSVLVVLLVVLNQQQSASRLIRSAASEPAVGEAQQLGVGQLTTPQHSLHVRAASIAV
jgi:hypothetical protein